MSTMAEASMAAFGAAIGVLIAMAVVTFGLRGKGHPDPELNAYKKKLVEYLYFLFNYIIVNFSCSRNYTYSIFP